MDSTPDTFSAKLNMQDDAALIGKFGVFWAAAAEDALGKGLSVDDYVSKVNQSATNHFNKNQLWDCKETKKIVYGQMTQRASYLFLVAADTNK